eukprot:gene14453-18287_t
MLSQPAPIDDIDDDIDNDGDDDDALSAGDDRRVSDVGRLDEDTDESVDEGEAMAGDEDDAVVYTSDDAPAALVREEVIAPRHPPTRTAHAPELPPVKDTASYRNSSSSSSSTSAGRSNTLSDTAAVSAVAVLP